MGYYRSPGFDRTSWRIFLLYLGIFGGTFDPIHLGHLILAESLRQSMGIEEVVFVPAGRPPHKSNRQLASETDRLDMVRAAIEGRTQFCVSDMEIRRGGPSFTLETLRMFREKRSPLEPVLFLGLDNLSQLPTWAGIDQLLQEFQILIGSRPEGREDESIESIRKQMGTEIATKLKSSVVKTPLVGFSSSEIRERCRRGLSISFQVPTAVEDYILSKGLYR